MHHRNLVVKDDMYIYRPKCQEAKSWTLTGGDMGLDLPFLSHCDIFVSKIGNEEALPSLPIVEILILGETFCLHQ